MELIRGHADLRDGLASKPRIPGLTPILEESTQMELENEEDASKGAHATGPQGHPEKYSNLKKSTGANGYFPSNFKQLINLRCLIFFREVNKLGLVHALKKQYLLLLMERTLFQHAEKWLIKNGRHNKLIIFVKGF